MVRNQRNQRYATRRTSAGISGHQQTSADIISAARPTTYRGANARSRGEARYLALCDIFGWQWEHEPELGRWFKPDILAVTPNGPVILEVKPGNENTSTADLAQYEQRIYDNLAGCLYPIIIVGRTPIIAVTDARCDGQAETTAGISMPGADGGCGLWKYHQFTATGGIVLVPHCSPLPAMPDAKIMLDYWPEALEALKFDSPKTAAVLPRLVVEDEAAEDDTG